MTLKYSANSETEKFGCSISGIEIIYIFPKFVASGDVCDGRDASALLLIDPVRSKTFCALYRSTRPFMDSSTSDLDNGLAVYWVGRTKRSGN